MQELMCFSAFLYQYIESLMFLEVARRGDSSPPKSVTAYIAINIRYVVHACLIMAGDWPIPAESSIQTG